MMAHPHRHQVSKPLDFHLLSPYLSNFVHSNSKFLMLYSFSPRHHLYFYMETMLLAPHTDLQFPHSIISRFVF